MYTVRPLVRRPKQAARGVEQTPVRRRARERTERKALWQLACVAYPSVHEGAFKHSGDAFASLDRLLNNFLRKR